MNFISEEIRIRRLFIDENKNSFNPSNCQCKETPFASICECGARLHPHIESVLTQDERRELEVLRRQQDSSAKLSEGWKKPLHMSTKKPDPSTNIGGIKIPNWQLPLKYSTRKS